MFGRHGKILRVDLTNEKVSVEGIDPQTAKDFIGFYRLRGWDEDGVPTEAKLTKLGLER
jgi:aldehyde:ferredoxin oxidoreductase